MSSSTERKPYFRLPEYERPGEAFVHDGIELLMRLQDPVYRRLQVRRVEHVMPTTVALSSGGEFVTKPMQGATEFKMPGRAVVSGRYDELVDALAESAKARLAEVMPQFFKAMDEITAAADQVVDAGGTPLSHELIVRTLERIDIDFDEEGRPKMPTMIGGPKMAEAFQKLGQPTPEQEASFRQLIERKYREFLARKRYRRLPR